MIHYCQGSGGMFLTAVFAKFMNIKLQEKISVRGDCHDYGNGVWNRAPGISVAHTFDIKLGRTKFRYLPGSGLYETHNLTSEFVEQNADLTVVRIDADESDYINIARLAVKKAHAMHWTLQEYNKWVSSDYPPFSPNNLEESDLIVSDLVNDFIITQTKPWFIQHASIKYSHTIDFKTVMGLNNRDLVQEVANITDGQITDDICKFVHNYQQLNKKLYFN
jgi:hypothetical protein